MTTLVDATVGLPWACPMCRGALDPSFSCTQCRHQVPLLADGRPDFRLTSTTLLQHEWRYDPEFGRFPWDRVRNYWTDAGHDVHGGSHWHETERSMIRAIPRAPGGEPKLALDIGCGSDRQRFREGLLALGYRTVGLDISGDAPDALADAHRLPLSDHSVDLAVTNAVWEHLKHPHVAMNEVGRVLKPGGRMIGAAAFNEPFHISYFHHSPLAIYEILTSAGLEVEEIILFESYSAVYAHLDMGAVGIRIPRVLHGPIADAARWMFLAPAALKGRESLARARSTFARSHSAAVGFVAVRPAV